MKNKNPADERRKSPKRVGLVAVNAIRLDFQPLENLIEETVHDYVGRIERGEALAPLSVRFDGQSYFLEDGFHRVEAAKRCGVKSLRAEIVAGTLAEMEVDFRDYIDHLKKSLSRQKGKSLR